MTSPKPCLPRYSTPRRRERDSYGDQLAAVSAALGLPLMPWQRHVVDVACELDGNGRPAYRDVVVTVPRQQGKTTLMLAWLIHRALLWGRPTLSVYTAQTGDAARKKWRNELFPFLERSTASSQIRNISLANGSEGITWMNGSLLNILSPTHSIGHGMTIDGIGIIDEFWHFVDNRTEQGLRPAMLTVPDAQLLKCSTAGTDASLYYNTQIELGRQAVADDTGRGLAFFEWSIADDQDIDDPATWRDFMPALGRTVDPDTIATDMAGMTLPERLRAYGNRPTATSDTVLPEALWERVCRPQIAPEGDCLGFAFDVAQDRSTAAVAASDGHRVELVDHRPGTGWVVDRCNQLTAAHGGPVGFDKNGPAGALGDLLDRPAPLQNQEVVKACGSMFDAICQGNVLIRQDDRLDASARGVVKRKTGDTFVWSRTASTTDVTPLMASTLARWTALHPPGPGGPAMFFGVID